MLTRRAKAYNSSCSVV